MRPPTMASTFAPTITPDTVMSFDINPGTLLQFLESRSREDTREDTGQAQNLSRLGNLGIVEYSRVPPKLLHFS